MLSIDVGRSSYNLIKESKQAVQVMKLFEYAIRYAYMRAEYSLASTDERVEMDITRSSAHNAFIDQCNILSRLMAHVNEDNSWRGALGNDRKVIGDFACYLALFLSLSAR